jgi:hypothetical protein
MQIFNTQYYYMTRSVTHYRDVSGNVSTAYSQFVYFCRHD